MYHLNLYSYSLTFILHVCWLSFSLQTSLKTRPTKYITTKLFKSVKKNNGFYLFYVHEKSRVVVVATGKFV